MAQVVPNLPELLAKLRERLEREEIDCPGDAKTVHGIGLCACKGNFWNNYKIPNPAYAGLLAVVRIEKPCPHSELIDDVPVFYKPKQCPGCHGKPRYITRSWEGMPEWWLSVILTVAALNAGIFPIFEFGAYIAKAHDDPPTAIAAVLEQLG